MLFGKPHYRSASKMFVKSMHLSFNAFLRKVVYSFGERVITSHNSIVNCVINSNVFIESTLNAVLVHPHSVNMVIQSKDL